MDFRRIGIAAFTLSYISLSLLFGDNAKNSLEVGYRVCESISVIADLCERLEGSLDEAKKGEIAERMEVYGISFYVSFLTLSDGNELNEKWKDLADDVISDAEAINKFVKSERFSEIVRAIETNFKTADM
jgi:hypothetical protein